MKDHKLNPAALKELAILQTEIRQALAALRQNQEKIFPVIAATFELESHFTESDAVLSSIGDTPSLADAPAVAKLVEQRTQAEVPKQILENERDNGYQFLDHTPAILAEVSRVVKSVLELVVASWRAEIALDLAKYYVTPAEAEAVAGDIPAIKTANARIADLSLLSQRTFAQFGNESVPASYLKIKAALQLAENILTQAQRTEPDFAAFLA